MTTRTMTKAPNRHLNSNLRLNQALEAVPDTDLESDPPGWTRWITIIVLILAAIGMFATYQLTRTASDETVRADVAEVERDIADTAAVSLAEQIEAECRLGRLTGPICQEASDVTAPGGRDGTDGIDGRPGVNGRDGRDGRDGLTPPCLSMPRQCAGEDGAAGLPGANGENGLNGEPGEDGEPGERGQTGPQGPPPESFTFTDGSGVKQTCSRDSDSTPTAPTYSCTSASSSTQVPAGTTLRF